MKISVPKPSAEVKKLGYFVGNWTTTGTISPGPWGDGGKFSWSEVTEWMTGNFFVVGHWNFKMPRHLGGNGEEIFVMGYDTDRRVYTFNAFSSQGRHQVSQGILAGDTWAWTSEAIYDGDKVQQKLTMRILSAKAYTQKFEICMDGAWMTFMDGQTTKSQATRSAKKKKRR
jgi:hypothetical protein